MDVAAILKEKGTKVITAYPDATVANIVSTLSRERVGVVVICEKDGELAGIVSERDVVRGLAERGQTLLSGPVSGLMTTDVSTCSPNDKVGEIMATMTAQRIRHIPVMESETLCGIISIGDVVKHRLDEIESEADALRQYVTSA
jgi:CBS domain-containing protein